MDRKDRAVSSALHIGLPVVIAEGRGVAFDDLDGNTLLDFTGGMGCNLVGHSHPKVVAAATRQAARFSHTDFTVVPYELYIDVCERLADLVRPGFKAALFNSGGEAIENAVKYARSFTGRSTVLCFEGGFHGRTLLGMTLSSRSAYKRTFGPMAPDVVQVPFAFHVEPDPMRAVDLTIEALRRIFITVVDPREVGCVVLEPIQGEGGIVRPPVEFFSALGDLCRAHGILIVTDEIQSGCGRTGTFLASEPLGLIPDIVCLGKALGAGYPISAVVGRAEVMDSPERSAIGGTYIGNPVACAAATAVLDLIVEGDLMARAAGIENAIRSKWQSAGSVVPEVGEIRGVGAMMGVTFVDPVDGGPGKEIAARVRAAAGRNGVVTAGGGLFGNVIRHLVPLVISDDALEEGLNVLVDAAAEVSQTSRTTVGPVRDKTEARAR